MQEVKGRYGGWRGFYRQIEELSSSGSAFIDIPIAGQLVPGTYRVEVSAITLAQTFFDMKLQSLAIPGTHSERIYVSDNFSRTALGKLTGVWYRTPLDAKALVGHRFRVRLDYQPDRYRIKQTPMGYALYVNDKQVGGLHNSIRELEQYALGQSIRKSFIEIAEYEYL